MSETDHSGIKLRSAFQTDVGVVREHNEDSAAVDEESDFFVVADGMGGHAAGEVASAMAVETVKEELAAARDLIKEFGQNPSDDGRKKLVAILEAAVRKAHAAVYERGIREPDKQGMGTTLDVVLLAGPEAFVAHVGDSRTYLIRDGKAAQITTDHTVAEVLVIEGKLSIEEAQLSPLRTILVNAIGVAPDVGVEMAHVRLRTDDSLLLCSDGLHDYFPAEHELAEHIAASEPKEALNNMVELAKSRGGHDNITGIIVEVLDAPPDDFSASPFEVDLTQPAQEASDGVPDAVSRGDTLPHELVDESDIDDDKTEPVELEPAEAPESEDLKTTIPMRPLGGKKKAKAKADDDDKGSAKDAAAREKLGRASTIPPEGEEDGDATAASDGDQDTLPLEPTDPSADAVAPPDDDKDDAKDDDKDDDKADEAKAEDDKAEAKDDDAKDDDAKDDKAEAKDDAKDDDAKPEAKADKKTDGKADQKAGKKTDGKADGEKKTTKKKSSKKKKKSKKRKSAKK